MNEQEIIFAAIDDLEAVLPANYRVRTAGGDAPAGPPLCVLEWDSTRISENGANSFGKFTRDIDGNVTGRELHRYRLMTLDVEIRTYDESERDLLLSDVEDQFSPYEYDSSGFHEDTTEWDIGGATPRSNPVVEPDWYEGGLTIRFKYVKRTEQQAVSLGTIQQNIDADTSG